MNKILEMMIDFAATLTIVFISTLIYFGLKTEVLIKIMDKEIMGNFLEETQKNGYITENDYEGFIDRLSLTEVLYDVDFEHRYTIFEPEYRMRTLEEILEAQRAAYTDTNIYHDREVETHAPIISDPIDNSGLTMNTETNAGILAAAVPSVADPNHLHTEECYVGHVHKGGDNLKFIHNHTHTYTCRSYVSSITYKNRCNMCTQNYYVTTSYFWLDSNGSIHAEPGAPTYYGICVFCGSNNITHLSGEIPSISYTCGYETDINGDGFTEAVPYNVNYQYSCNIPQNKYKAAYTSGCYSYHSHYTYDDEERYWSGSSSPGGDAFNTAARIGFDNYCSIPEDFYIGTDSLHYSFPSGLCVRYKATYNPQRGLIFKFIAYRVFYSYEYITTNPGFPQELTSSQMYDAFGDKYKVMYQFKKNVPQYSYSVDDASYRVIHSGMINLCNSPIINQWNLSCGKEGNGYLACNQIVASITPTNPTQAVFTGEELITTARATYMDGSTGVILCTTHFRTENTVKNEDVTITYTNIKGSILTAHLTVTVVPRTKICKNCHTYNLKPDGTDPGCPFCKAYVDSIRVQYPTTSIMTITIGTTLQENGLILLVRYMDGRTETIDNGYVDNLDKSYKGTKLVTIGYKGAITSIMVTTVCKKMTCDICGYLYDLNPNGSNPGCPMCISKTPVFAGNILEYESIDYTEEILEDLYMDGIYLLRNEDTFSVTLTNRSSTLTRNLLKIVYHALPDRWLFLRDSIIVKNN